MRTDDIAGMMEIARKAETPFAALEAELVRLGIPLDGVQDFILSRTLVQMVDRLGRQFALAKLLLAVRLVASDFTEASLDKLLAAAKPPGKAS